MPPCNLRDIKPRPVIPAKTRDRRPNLRQKNRISHRPYLLQNRVFKERITPKNTAFILLIEHF